jgi:glycerol-3-phosphate dehydrogenase (NAD(P)+)
MVAGVSSVGIEWFVDKISKHYKRNLPIVLLTKGLAIVDNELTTLSDKIKKLLKKQGHEEINISAIKGPCLAAGLANKMRTGTVIANPDIKEAQFLKKIISTKYYSTEISNDLNGVELSGAIKNIYSMLIGASEGLSNSKVPLEIQSKYYLNTAASLIHRSISEMVEFVSHYGGNSGTVYGLAGLGDLYVSAIGGRNSLMGKYLGQGNLYKEAKEKFMKNITVEGAQLALEIGPKILQDLNPKHFPLMFSMLNTVCKNKKLEIDW